MFVHLTRWEETKVLADAMWLEAIYVGMCLITPVLNIGSKDLR